MQGFDYEALLRRLEDEIRSRGSLTVEELVEWGEAQGIGVVTLFLLVNDLVERGVARASTDKRLVDEELGIELPLQVDYCAALQTTARPGEKTPRRGAERRRGKGPRGPAEADLMSFLFPGEGEEGAEEREEAKPQEVEERGAVEGDAAPVPMAAIEDRDFMVALSYLTKYWSVGEVRFLVELKSLGVEKPEEVLFRIIREGLAQRSSLGVINADVGKIKSRYRVREMVPSTSLADLLGG